MTKYFNSFIGLFRLTAFIEGLSLLVLLFIAMPLKYAFDKPEMVRMVGSAHGFLFLLFVVMAIVAAVSYKWSIVKTGLILLSSFVPFGTFIADHKVFKGIHQELQNQTQTS